MEAYKMRQMAINNTEIPEDWEDISTFISMNASVGKTELIFHKKQRQITPECINLLELLGYKLNWADEQTIIRW